MATGTGGTTASTSLVSIQFSGAMAAADIATIANDILDDKANLPPNSVVGSIITPVTIFPGAFSPIGQLFVPNRGVLKIFPGDRVMVDTVSGWPVLVSRAAIGVGSAVWNSTV